MIAKYYGCGLNIPDFLEGAIVLDLGCGSGRDVFLAAQLVGPKGSGEFASEYFVYYLNGKSYWTELQSHTLELFALFFLIVLVIGVDMTVEQLKVRIDTQSWHAEKFGYVNTEFLLGDIEKL